MHEQGERATLRWHVTTWSSSLALHRHPRRDATLKSYLVQIADEHSRPAE